jgi:hypothetical protein
MRIDKVILLAGFMTFAAYLSAEPTQVASPVSSVGGPGEASKANPAIEVSLGYTYLHANAPPGTCECFSFNGGYGAFIANLPHGLSVVGDISAATASNISGTTEGLTVVNYLFGPRYSWRPGSGRFTTYGQFLLGGSSQSSNIAAVPHVSAFAFSPGGGVSVGLTHHFGLNLAEVDWLHSQLPNAGNNRQNDLRISSGVLFRF